MSFKRLSRPSAETDSHVKQHIIETLSSMFPIDGNFFILNAKNFKIAPSNASLKDIKNALIKGGSIMSGIKADVSLIDKKTRKIIDKKRMTIMRIPDFTKKGSFIVDGNSYTVPYQQRLKAGVYTMAKRNGQIETMFNLAKGRNFILKLDDSGIFRIKIGSSHVPMYSILHDLGVSDAEISSVIGDPFLKINKKQYHPGDSAKFVKQFNYNTENSKISTIQDAISITKLDPSVTEHTLGIKKDTVDPSVFLAAAKKLKSVKFGKEKEDDRENLIYKKIMTPERILSESYDKIAKDAVNKIRFKLNNPNIVSITDVLGSGSGVLTKPIKTFLSTSKISRLSEEYNPLMMHSVKHTLTPMGEGGVGDTRALNLDTKAVHPSHLGFIDPIVSPEGASVGVTLAVTDNSYVDKEGNPAIKVINSKTNKAEIKRISELWDKKLAYPISPEKAKKDGIVVRYKDKDMVAKSKKDIDYIIPYDTDMHAPSLNMVPLVNSSDANRTNMAQKHLQQALSLKEREAPIVSVKTSTGGDMSSKVVHDMELLPRSPVDGMVTRITDEFIYIKSGRDVHKVDYMKDMPLARKTYLTHHLKVKVGDRVKKGQILADSNYSKNGKLALGKNLRTAWLSMSGNRNDGIVISETAAKELSSLHMYKEIIDIPHDAVIDRERFRKLYPDIMQKWPIDDYDAQGVIKKGKTIKYGQPLVLKMIKSDARDIKSKLGKVLHKPYKAVLSVWKHEKDGEVVEVEHNGAEIRIAVRTESEAKIGDKLSGRQGNKGIITKILPDEQMPMNKKGEPVHVLMTSAGVISRTNSGSLIEAGLAKVGDKAKKTYGIGHYEKADNLKFLQDEAKKHGVQLYEELINPETGKPFPKKIFVGKPYILKLFKDSESGMSAVGVGSTDINEQPLKGGKESASSVSGMEVNALLAHGAKDYLREARNIKGQKNDDFFNAFRHGMPLPPPKEHFATEKFKAYLKQININPITDKNTKEFSLIPMSDKDVMKMSSGAIKNTETVSAKNMKVVKGGLFDESIFGGPAGTRYGHINLPSKILNPLYKEYAASLINVPAHKLIDSVSEKGFSNIRKDISKINIDKKLKELRAQSADTKNPQLINKNIKMIKFLEKVKNSNKTLDDALFISKIPVIPPVYRPIAKGLDGSLTVNDLNMFYQDIGMLSDSMHASSKVSKATRSELEKDLYKTVGALYGVEETPNKKLQNKNVKGVLGILGGDTPKKSFVHKTMLRSKQFMSGRGVIKPARTDINLDEIEIPEKMGLSMYAPHIHRSLARRGYPAMQINEMIENKDPIAVQTLHELSKTVPVVYNRAPTLWRHNMIGGYPKFIKGNTIGINPLTERALNADYDGDTVSVHVPLTDKAIEDVKNKMLPSKGLFTEEKNTSTPDNLYLPDQDSTLGIFKASVRSRRPVVKVKDMAELKQKISLGEINYNDKVTVMH